MGLSHVKAPFLRIGLLLAVVMVLGCAGKPVRQEKPPEARAAQEAKWGDPPPDSRDSEFITWMALHHLMTPRTLPSHHDEHHGFSSAPRHYTPVVPHYAPVPSHSHKPAYKPSYSAQKRSSFSSRPYRSQSRFYRSSFSGRRR